MELVTFVGGLVVGLALGIALPRLRGGPASGPGSVSPLSATLPVDAKKSELPLGRYLDADMVLDEALAPDEGHPYSTAADVWVGHEGEAEVPDDKEEAARRLYDLALTSQERSQRDEARFLDQFEEAAAPLAGKLGELIVVDDDDERLTLQSNGSFRAEVAPKDADRAWRTLHTADELVEFYDPTDVFGDLADALAEAYPAIAPEIPGEETEE